MINLDPSGAQAPMWVVNAAVSTFVLAGISLIANVFGLALVSRLAVAAVAWMLAVPGLWILFDGQGAQCSVSVSLGGLSTAGSAASGLCRTVFGMGGVITLAIAIVFTVVALRPRRSPELANAKGADAAPSNSQHSPPLAKARVTYRSGLRAGGGSRRTGSGASNRCSGTSLLSFSSNFEFDRAALTDCTVTMSVRLGTCPAAIDRRSRSR